MTTPHLEPDAVARAAAGTLSHGERDMVLKHLETCSACREDATYAAAFERRSRNRRMLLAGGAVAAALAVVVVLPFEAPPLDPSTGPAVSVRSGEEGIPEVPVHAPASGAVVEGDSIRFSWADMGEHAQYRFWLSTATGAPLWDRALSDTVTYVDARSELESGGSYLWFVDALLADGGTAQSGVRSFTVR